MKKLANGIGSVYKLSGNRRNPWAARKTIGKNEKGHPIYKFIGFYRTRTEAMRALMEYNKSPYSLDGERLIDMYNRFIEAYKLNHKPKTVHNIEISWDHLKPLHEKSIAKLSRKDLQLYFDGLEVTEQVKHKIRSTLRMIYDYSIRYDVIQPERVVILDYIDLSSKVAGRTVERKPFTKEEIKRLEQMDDNMSRIVLFLIYTGLRAGEFCDMTDKSIDEDMVIHISDSKTAAGIRDVPLSEKAKKLLPVPHFDGYEYLKYYFTVWRTKNGFDHTLHDTRHTLVSLLTEAKVDDRIIKSIVGHKGKDVTEKVYTHISIEAKREALNLI